MGSLAYWVLKLSGKETFVPFGLSTFRSLQWGNADAVLIVCCLVTAVLCLATGVRGDGRSQAALRSAGVAGLVFVSMGLLGWYVDSDVGGAAQAWREAVHLEEADELQPAFLNVWFLGWGGFCVWYGLLNGLSVLDRIGEKLRSVIGWPAPPSTGSGSAQVVPVVQMGVI